MRDGGVSASASKRGGPDAGRPFPSISDWFASIYISNAKIRHSSLSAALLKFRANRTLRAGGHFPTTFRNSHNLGVTTVTCAAFARSVGLLRSNRDQRI